MGSPWQLEEDKRSQDPQLQSLPGDLSLLQDTPFSEVVSYSKNCSQPPSDISSLPTSSATSADPPSQRDPGPSPSSKLDPTPSQSPCSRTLRVPTQSTPPKSQLLASTEPNSDAVWKLQSIQSPLCSHSAENTRNQPPRVLLGQAHIQPLKELGAPTSYVSHVSKQQGPQDRQPRVADLKKCFEN